MVINPLGSEMVSTLVQFSNAHVPIVVTVFESTTFPSDVQP